MENKEEIIRIINKYKNTEYIDVAADEILLLFNVSNSVCEHLHQKWEGEGYHNFKIVCQVCRKVLTK